MFTYPHTIENGGGEKIVFLRRVQEGGDDYLEVENFVAPGSGPPMHVHYLQDESLTVVSGKIGYQALGEEPKYGEAGDTILFKRGISHKFWNAGTDELHCKGWVRPPHNIEYFLTAIYESTRNNGGKMPHPADAAFLLKQYESEFGMLEIPGFVQRFIFPLQLRIGRMTGRYRKYQDAPTAIRA
jgi:quercetin dioxygenase-like cupin family protein